jgi:diaminohydroxyphosphoribosylaminopyrimidine deaminase/5-amino-6-(5-phosphoribosylamino)uracil reductase
MTEFDASFMHRALALARRSEGRVEPDPMVGCVIVKRGRVIGEGYHRRFGSPHAEVEALRACRTSPRGATAYVSLEPCCHWGKTPPCTDALIEAHIGEVVIPFKDPFPQVAGGGVRQLRRSGITVRSAVLADEAAEVLAPFLTLTCLDRPYVVAKWAQSLDAQLVTPPGTRRWISSEDSRRKTHRLRARVDAILVGIETVLADDPMLTARDVPIHRRAIRLVLDSRLRIPLSCRLVESAAQWPTIVVTSPSRARSRKAMRLGDAGVEVLACAVRSRRLALRDCLAELGRRRVTNLLVEGGPTVLTSFFKAGLVDEAWVFVAPFQIGGPNGRGLITVPIQPRHASVEQHGEDVLFRMGLTTPPQRTAG